MTERAGRAGRPPRAIGLWLTTAIWIAATGGLWAWHDHQLKNGTELELKTVPVDPSEILRGDYVTLRYEISTYREEGPRLQMLHRNRPVYVALERREGRWAIAGVHPQPPATGFFLRGRVRSVAQSRLEIAYGIESFFVPEGEGKRYEEARNRDRLWAVVSVNPHGVGFLKRLEIR